MVIKMDDKILKLQDKIIERLGVVNDETFIKVFVDWIGFEAMFDLFADSINSYDDEEGLRELLNSLTTNTSQTNK